MGFDWMRPAGRTRSPVANLVGSMPFGPAPEVALAWMFEGGGLEIIQRAYDPYDVKIIPCHLVASEAGGWFNKEINSVEDLEGLNMRISGLGGKALARLGANTQMIPAGELYVSLERGRIDALEFSAPALDVGFGFQEVADYSYFPGWRQPSSWDSIIINMDVWNGFGRASSRASSWRPARPMVTERLAEQLERPGGRHRAGPRGRGGDPPLPGRGADRHPRRGRER
ncbi:MAG: hypothetical protein U5L11_07855 [Arhodomonas sp.]|nr:hypothetical protein [Arhodomonas sp.]